MEVRGVERYQPEKLPVLERNLEEQAAGASSYSLDVATAAFRLYQLQPSLARRDLIARVLLRALAQMPKQDYRILIHMLPEKLVAEEPVSSVVLLAQHLEACNLQDFWAATGSCRDTISKVPGFQDAIRAYVLHSISITFQRVSMRVLADWLKLEGSALQQLLADKAKAGWKVQGDVVCLPLNAFNQAVQKRTQDLISFEAVAPVVKSTVASA
ncbi:eukaryotic translation initiation factor 3k [Scenedesmus sp. NREL 46B-D3]|nr:eukaryotic translation initiation factor 3k [Scenedesmus sp. NREL 46B-D3]